MGDAGKNAGACEGGGTQFMLWFVSAIAATAIAVVSLALMRNARPENMRSAQTGRLVQIGMCLRHDAVRNADRYPNAWGSSSVDPALLVRPTADFLGLRRREVLPPPHYILVAGRRIGDPPSTVLAYCHPALARDGGCVLYVDGRIEWLDRRAFNEKLRAVHSQGVVPPGPATMP